MKIREAIWEKRNLGVKAFDFFIGVHETAEEVFPEIRACDAEYQVLHVASGNTEVLLKAQQEGFQFIEMGVQMELSAKKFACPQIYRRFEPYLSYSVANEDEIKNILEIIKAGTMFTTDRISRDPYFGVKQAGIRYVYWLDDAIKKGAVLILTKYKGNTIGFDSAMKDKDGTVTTVLGGLFPEYSDTGLGFVPIYLIIQWMMKAGGKRMFTNMSSNNLPIIKLHETFGFTTRTTSYTLVKHFSKVVN